MALKKLTPEQIRLHKGLSFTGISTVFFCYDQAGRILLQKRSAKARDENGRWDPGAGGLKHGQSVIDSLKREIKEEYGVQPLKIDFIGYRDAFRTNSNGLATHWLALDFAVLVDPKKIKISEPDMIDEIGWFSLNKLPQPLHSQFDSFYQLHGKSLEGIIRRHKNKE